MISGTGARRNARSAKRIADPLPQIGSRDVQEDPITHARAQAPGKLRSSVFMANLHSGLDLAFWFGHLSCPFLDHARKTVRRHPAGQA